MRRHTWWTLLAPMLIAGCGMLDSPSAPVDALRDERFNEEDVGESGRLADLFGTGWDVALISHCPSEWLVLEDVRVNTDFVGCFDPEQVRSSVVLIDSDGQVVRWYDRVFPARAAIGCFTPDAAWAWAPGGISIVRDVGAVVECDTEGDPSQGL